MMEENRGIWGGPPFSRSPCCLSWACVLLMKTIRNWELAMWLQKLPQWIWYFIVWIRLDRIVGLDKFLRRWSPLDRVISRDDLRKCSLNFDLDTFVACAASDRLSEVKLFTSAKIALNVPGRDGDTALTAAAREGRQQIVRHLLNQPGIDVNAQNNAHDTPLIVAAWRDRRVVVKLLLKYRAQVDFHNDAGESALLEAARRDLHTIV